MKLTREQEKALMKQWIAAAPLLRKQRHRDIRRQNNAKAIEALTEISNYNRKRAKSRRTSGLVEMYKALGWKPEHNR